MKPLFIIPVFIPIFLVLSSCSSVPKEGWKSKINEQKEFPYKEIILLSGSFNVNRYTFENGLKLLVVEDHASPTFAYQTWFRVGSRDEAPGRTGLAHLFEHMMFKETKSLKDGQFDKILEEVGAEGENAFTSRDYTAYIQELPKNKLDLIAKVESDRMVNLVINQNAFKTEREVVQNERRYRNENSPDGLMDQELFQLAFKKHSYHWPVIGYQVDLENMSAEDALSFYRSHYSPNHATVIVVGDVNADHVSTIVQKHYAELKNQPENQHRITKESAQTSPRRKQLKLNIQVEKLLMGYHIPETTHEDMPAVDVMQNILTGGKSSRLYKALVSTGIATSAESYDFDDKDPSLFVVTTNLQKNKHVAQAESIILKELHRISNELVSEQEIERAKNKINFSFFESLNSNYEKAAFLGHYDALTNDFTIGLKEHEKIQLITPQDVQRVAKKYLDPKGRTVITGVQK